MYLQYSHIEILRHSRNDILLSYSGVCKPNNLCRRKGEIFCYNTDFIYYPSHLEKSVSYKFNLLQEWP